jgi:hypothetical protein
MMYIPLMLIAFFLVGPTELHAQQALKVHLNERSRITIKGTTNLNTFEFSQSGKSIENPELKLTVSKPANNRYTLGEHKVGLLVKKFTSDDLLAQQAFYNMMDARRHPRLYVRLKQIEPLTMSLSKSTGKAQLEITITGKPVVYDIHVSSEKTQTYWILRGSKKLSIRDFGIQPPRVLGGLMQVSEWIDVSLDIYCSIENYETELATK